MCVSLDGMTKSTWFFSVCACLSADIHSLSTNEKTILLDDCYSFQSAEKCIAQKILQKCQIIKSSWKILILSWKTDLNVGQDILTRVFIHFAFVRCFRYKSLLKNTQFIDIDIILFEARRVLTSILNYTRILEGKTYTKVGLILPFQISGL